MPRRRRPPRAGALTELPPLKILGQIAAIQALYYGCALFLMVFTTLVAGTSFSLDLVFGWNAVRGDTTQGWLMAFVWVLDGGLFMYGPLSRHISWPCFPLVPKSVLVVLTRFSPQVCCYRPPRRTLKTRSRLCPVASLYPLGGCDILFGTYPPKRHVVAYHGDSKRRRSRPRNMGLPLPRIKAHIFRRLYCRGRQRSKP